jgi:hypothetical protein
MKKFFLIIFILIVLFIIYHYSKKENFFSSTFTIDKIGLNNLNNYNPMVCNITNSGEPAVVDVTDNKYEDCFTDGNKDKYIEIDKTNNKCNVYNNVSCNDNGDGGLLTNLNNPNKILFRIKSRDLLLSPQEVLQTTQASETTSVSISSTTSVNMVTRILDYIDTLYVNVDSFKLTDSFLTNNLFDFLNDSNHINLNDYFCCLAEHLFVVRLLPTQESNNSDNIVEKLNSYNIPNLVTTILKLLNESNFNSNKQHEYYIKLESKKANDYLLCYNIQILKVVLLYYIIQNIKNDDYYKKYNSSYITYLYNSFKRGKKVWGEYFNKCIDKLILDDSVKETLKKIIIINFFSNQNNENIYKLFIYTSALNNNLKYYNSTTSSHVSILTYNNNKLSPINNLHNNLYVFYYSNEVKDNNKMCSTIDTESDCNNLSTYGCSYDKENKKCVGQYTNKNCMQIANKDICNEDSNCEYNDTKNVCEPKTCFSSSSGEPECANHSHCENLQNIKIGDQVFNQCYDKVRIVRNVGVNSKDNYYDKNDNINDRCINKIYKENGERVNNQNILTKCKDGCVISSHNDTKTCIKPNFINENTFFDNKYCDTIKNEFNCDFTPNCFWQNNNCYSNSLGNDTMKCEDFDSVERCPKNKCVWYENKCKDIYDIARNNNVIESQSQSQNKEDVIVDNKFEIEKPNCLSINNEENLDNIDKMNECLYNNCEWVNERNLCVDKINKGCLIKNYNNCVNPIKNFNPIINRNMCKLITDQNNPNGRQLCVDNNLQIPCNFYNKNDCPTDKNPKVNLKGEIIEQPYCKISIDGNKCVEKNNNNETCLYNYLKEGDKVDNYSKNCKEIEISVNENNVVQKMDSIVNKQNLPCSLLHIDNCTYGKNKNACKVINGKCKTNKDKKILFEKLDDVINDMSFSSYEEITDRIGNIYAKQRSPRLCRLEDQIHGNMVELDNNEIVTNNNLTNLSIINNFIVFFVHLNNSDLIEILGINEAEFNKKKIEYENFLETLNILIKNKIELKHKLDLEDSKNMWISNKYKISNIKKSENKIVLDQKLFYKLNSSPMVTIYGNLIIEDIQNIEIIETGTTKKIKIPYKKCIKWFVPNPMSNLDDCLNDLKFKNLDKERYFNI